MKYTECPQCSTEILEEKCPDCEGRGGTWDLVPRNGDIIGRVCESCGGSGKTNNYYCTHCDWSYEE